ncbi:MAG: serine hydrolase domain-containing protein [Mycobacterium sp.]|uniref:serine hydrolase domain-containing protein n=1 Tax=Mycobacterium sp. TaxID=1785 RepID=UPI003C473308
MVLSALPSPLRPGWLRVQTVAAILGVALLVGACGGGSSPSPSSSAGSTPVFTPINQMTLRVRVTSMAREMLVPGAVALVRSPAGEISTTYGTATVGSRVPVSLADHVRIGSITKTWTGTVILQQAQEGKLSLGDPVSKFRPDVPDGDHITIAELLNMRSGLYNYSETRELNEIGDSDPQKVWNPDELLALAYSHPPYFPPGTGYHYSNTNTVLLGLIAEALDAKPLSQVFQDRLFTPLGLKDTLFPPPTSNAIPDPHPQGYMYGTNVLTMGSPAAIPPEMQAAAKTGTLQPGDQTSMNPSWAWAGGAGISTVADLATLAEALAEGKLLDPDMQSKRIASLQSTNPAQPDAPQYGLALAKFGALYGHTGEVPGFNTFAATDPKNKVTIVIWVNLDPTPDGRAAATLIAKALIDEMYGSPTPTTTR